LRCRQAAEEIGDSYESRHRGRPRLHDRLAWNIADDEFEDVAALRIDSEETRRPVEPNLP